MVVLDVQAAKKQIMRWLQNLRFARSEEELKLKAANIKVHDVDEAHGSFCCLVFP